ncbi:MAG: hypothetical protein PVG13_07515, partial [Thiohalophilus sp.]
TSSAASSVDRILNVFPSGEEAYVRTMLSTSLVGIISQQLIRRGDSKGRVAALEIMINNAAIGNVLREGKTEQLENIIQGGAMQGMQLMDTALQRLVDSQLITGEDAYMKARNKSQFSKYVEGYEEAIEDIAGQSTPDYSNADVEEIVLSSEPDLKS